MVVDIWLTSDLHINHRSICRGVSLWDDKAGCRDFNNLDDMNLTLIDNINAVVQEDDILWHLGDFALGPKKLWPEFRLKIKCQNIYHIEGNHGADWDKLGYKWFFKEIYGKQGEYAIVHRKFHGQEFCMSHFPILSWDNKNRNAICVSGHSHGSMNKWISQHMPDSRLIDVGIDTHPEFRPYNVDEVIDIMKNKKSDNMDHHTRKNEA